jgi:ABC-2 type transport system ATP-binding protein
MLLGMVHQDSGRAAVLGDDSRELRPESRARIAYLVEGHPLYRWMSVREALRFTRAFHATWNDRFASELLDTFEIPLTARISRLSNGQRAQVSLTLALAPDPELLILDDPTLGIDTVVRRELLESMINVIQRSGRTVLFSSHILGDVERVADRIGVIIDGVLRVDCPTEHFKTSLRRVVLEFTGSVPPFPACPGLVGQRKIDGKLELVIVDYGEEHAALVAGLAPHSVEVLEMNLEDAFIAYTRRRSRSLPTLEVETASC